MPAPTLQVAQLVLLPFGPCVTPAIIVVSLDVYGVWVETWQHAYPAAGETQPVGGKVEYTYVRAACTTETSKERKSMFGRVYSPGTTNTKKQVLGMIPGCTPGYILAIVYKSMFSRLFGLDVPGYYDPT